MLSRMLPRFCPLVPAQRVDGYTQKGYNNYQPEDPLKKAEIRLSRKRELIASKRALHKPHATEEQPVCPTCGGKKEDPLGYVSQTELHV